MPSSADSAVAAPIRSAEPGAETPRQDLTELEAAVTRTLTADEGDTSIEQPWVVGVPIIDGGFPIPLRAAEEHFPVEDGAFDARQSLDALLALRQEYVGQAEAGLIH